MSRRYAMLSSIEAGMRAGLWLALLAGAGSAAAAPAPGPMMKLDDTGANRCVRYHLSLKACQGTGQDGEFGRDATAPNNDDGRAGFRYTRVCTSGESAGRGSCPAQPRPGTGRDDWGCTRDDVTGLTWELKLTDGSVRDADRLVAMQDWGWGFDTVAELASALDAASLCGSTDWDAPTVSELASLLDYGTRTEVKIDARYFPHTPVGDSWGTPYPTQAINEGTVESLDFATGKSEFFYPGDGRHARLLVRPSDLQQPRQRFVPSTDGAEISDRWTGLVWQRCRIGTSWSGGTCVGKARDLSWGQALAAARAAGAPWRLANVKELLSLSDLRDGLIDQAAFPGTAEVALWSSTPWSQATGHAWKVSYYQYAEYEIRPSSTSERYTAFLVRDR